MRFVTEMSPHPVLRCTSFPFHDSHIATVNSLNTKIVNLIISKFQNRPNKSSKFPLTDQPINQSLNRNKFIQRHTSQTKRIRVWSVVRKCTRYEWPPDVNRRLATMLHQSELTLERGTFRHANPRVSTLTVDYRDRYAIAPIGRLMQYLPAKTTMSPRRRRQGPGPRSVTAGHETLTDGSDLVRHRTRLWQRRPP